VATVIFWSLRLLVALCTVGAAFLEWRIALVLAFTLAIEFVTYIGMALPLFSVATELLLVCPAGLLIGSAISVGHGRLTPWVAPVLACSTLIVLRGSLYAAGFASGTLGASELVANMPAALALVGGAAASLWLPAIVLRQLRDRQ
jgi:hypothetical protein